MIPELGHYALILALGLAMIQASIPIFGARSNDPILMGIASTAAVGQFVFVATAFAALVTAYVQSDFSVGTVFENSHSMMPLVYKITSAWGNHEGSMLLWVLILALFGALVAIFGGIFLGIGLVVGLILGLVIKLFSPDSGKRPLHHFLRWDRPCEGT